jgi:hypothetical protein
VKPGPTGWAQANGRNGVSRDEEFREEAGRILEIKDERAKNG